MGSTTGRHTDVMDVPTSEDPEPATTMEAPMDKLDVILQEIRESQLAIEQRLGSITMELSILKDDQKKLADRMKQTETSGAGILPYHKEHKTAIEHLDQQVESLQERVEDAEVRSQRNNVRIIGLPEGKEGQDATQLRITHNQKAHFFDTPDSVHDWLHPGPRSQDNALPPRQKRQPRKSK
ncbi:hypothetical protein NDU88_001479 [Pleurodeles waltl]|uniref:Uncharacterized protein n=1 Tax=Pleurodeles waltl TaxID=8319 RepID=A0AAV7R851_PLEWA|nr:hypothetical protein NDU88_001479 [Pleurodeles waltl]